MKLSGKLIYLLLIIQFGANAQSLLTVEEAVATALQSNHDVIIAKNAVAIGEINNTWSNTSAVPGVNATANKGFGLSNLDQKLNNGNITQKKGSTTQNLNAGLTVQWKIFDGFKMFATKERLEEIERLGQYQFLRTVNQTIFDVVANYYRIVLLTEQQEATRELIDLYRQRLQLAQTRLDIGTGAKFEVLEAEVDLNSQHSALLNLEKQIHLEKTDLTHRMGVDPSRRFTVEDTILLSTLPPFGESANEAANQNPEVLMARSDLAILQAEKKEINADRLPSVTVSGNYNFVRSRNSAGFTLYNQSYGPSAAIGLQIPVFQAGRIRRQLQIANIDIANQETTIAKIKSELNAALQKQYIVYQQNEKIIEIERRNLAKAHTNILIAMERYKVLNITAVELRQIQLSYNEIKNRLYTALYEAKVAEAAHGLLTGRLNFL